MADGKTADERRGGQGGQPCLLVLGMHRSGTSALARGLVVLGASLGDRLLPALPCNPRGFFEDEDVYACDHRLLAMLGVRWDSAEPVAARRLLDMAAGPAGRAVTEFLRAKRESGDILAVKDPCMSRLMPFWRPLLASAGLDPRCVLALRQPEAVAQSLAKRDDMEPAVAHALWLRYTLDALDGSAGLPRVLVSYERLLAAPARELGRVGHALGLEVDAAALAEFTRDFLDAGLCHHKPAASGDGAPEPGYFASLALRLHAGLEPLAAARPEALEAGLESGRLLRLREECVRALDDVSVA